LVVLVPILVVLAAASVACSDKTNGQAVPGDSTTAETSTTTRGSTPSRTTSGAPTSGTSPFADRKPCTLLPSSGATEMGFSGQGNEQKVGSARRCQWRITGATIKDSFTVSVGLWDTAGLKDLSGTDAPTPVPTVGKHEAVRIKDTAGCSIFMGVTEKSRVDTAANGGSVDKACELALKLATLIEPELP
jgi:hypothetical protein